MIAKCYNDEDEQNQEEMVRNLARDHVLWARQALEILYSFKNLESLAKMAPLLMNRIIDRHNRFALVSHVPKVQRTLMSKIFQKMGNAFGFNYWNPNGHYELNLANPVERDVAVTLIVMNKEGMRRMTAGENSDRSQYGNKSCFRNEKFNTKEFKIDADWQLPTNGVFEFDFMCLLDVPDIANLMPDDQIA